MPWATLELDPTLASERDVKRAYAKRLKTCRPDQDPEGFRKLHDAYTAALAELQWRGAGERGHFDSGLEATLTETSPAGRGEADEQALEAPVVPPVSFVTGLSPAQRAVAEAFDRLEAAISGGGAGIAGLVRATEAALYEHPAEVMRWGELMYDLIAKHGSHPDLRLKPEAMLFELEHGGAAATLAVIERLDREGSPQGIANLANLLLTNKQRIANPGAGIAAARLAGAAAFWVKRHSAPLADFAYEHLARGERDFHMQLIDRHAAMANLLYTVPDRFKSYWRQRIMHTPGKDAWDDEESRAALQWLDTSTLRGSQVREVLVGLLPEEVAATLRTKSSPSSRTNAARVSRAPASTAPDNTPAWDRDDRSSQALPARSNRPRQSHYQPSSYQPVRSSGGSNVSPWQLLWIVAIILKLVFLFSKCSSTY